MVICMITAQKLREILSYDPETGIWLWRIAPTPRVSAGSVAGRISNGYRLIGIDGRGLKASRLAWLYMTGEWPTNLVDHRDLDKSNDKWENLREATRSQNMANTKTQSNNSHKLKGVALCPKTGLFFARVMKDGKRVYLGHFPTAEEAHNAYVAASQQLFGEFARAA